MDGHKYCSCPPRRGRKKKVIAMPEEKKEKDAYLVVCENGFMRGRFDGPPILELEKCCRLRNSLCSCGGKHQIIRVVQAGEGRNIE